MKRRFSWIICTGISWETEWWRVREGCKSMLRILTQWFFRIRIRDGNKSGSGINSRIIFGRKILQFFIADPEPFLTLDPGWKNPDPGTATLVQSIAATFTKIWFSQHKIQIKKIVVLNKTTVTFSLSSGQERWIHRFTLFRTLIFFLKQIKVSL
jgi:hypothetical protein